MSLLDYIKRIFTNPSRQMSEKDRAEQKRRRRNQSLIAARECAAIVDDVIDDLDSPAMMENVPAFQRGVDLLTDPCFSSLELLGLSDNPARSIWQMGVVAVSRRDPEPELVDRLLTLLEEGGHWQAYFVLTALQVHIPLDRSLAGEIIISHLPYTDHALPLLIKIAVPVLTQRLEDGEVPTLGRHLKELNAEKGVELRNILEYWRKGALSGPAEVLQAELDHWQATFVDRDVLETIGRIWEKGSSLIDYPELARQVEDVLGPLSQTPRRSVLLAGEQGVGKSAVMRQVGQALMARGWLIFEAAAADLTAGQKYFGDLEQRLKELVAQIGGGRPVVWYVPDFQALSWAGTHQFSRSSILDLLLPLLESGEIALVGELPLAAYEQLAQDQPRLVSACEVCRVAPLAEEATLKLATAWAVEHGPDLLSAALVSEAWLLSRQYLRDRESPGCLLGFLKRTRKQVLAAGNEPARITRDDLIDVLAAMTSLPRQILDDRQVLDPKQLRAFFGKRILGQPEAVTCLVERITLIKAGLTDPSRPQGVFLFAGPTGTGKTEIAKALATFLFGSEERLLRYDMSEFQTTESLARLLGDGQNLDRESLTLKIRKQPFSVILLDEFEKAHPKVWDIFLQVFDDGRLTDPMGRTSDFRHAIIILTSNLGGQAATGVGLGFDQDGEGFRATDVDRAVVRAFRPEFLNRLDRVVVFRPFTREIMRELLNKELHDVQQRRGLRNRQWDVVWEDSALEFLLDKGFSATLGARPLKRAIERHLLTPLAETIVGGHFPAGDQFLYVQAAGDRLLTEFIDPEASSDPPVGEAVEIEPGLATGLAAIALNPRGTAAEFADLWDHWQRLRDHLDSSDWKEAKTLALSMMSLPDFWDSTERHVVLGEVEYRERVESGLAATGSLLPKIAPPGRGPKEYYPRQLVGQAAGRLHLLDLACQALASGSPWEAFVLIESKQEAGSDGSAAGAWADRLGSMYQQWAGHRKMRVEVLRQVGGKPGRSRSLLLAVSGYAAYTILAPEAGLHIWEEPVTGRPKSADQIKALVRVAPLPAERVAEGREALLKVAVELLGEADKRVPPVVRTYRQLPDPLVKDRCNGWRTGRLDRVLAGDFDLLRACAEHDAAAGAG